MRKTVIVTGSSKGIGAATAILFAQSGWNVVINYNESFESANLLCRSLVSNGYSAIIQKANVANKLEVDIMVKEALYKFGSIDVLVNNAGVCFVKPMEETTYEELDLMMKTNVYAPYMLCKCAVPILRLSDCPTIINMGSVVSHKGYPTQSAYSTAKHALLGMTRALAAEVYRDGIRVHILCPGAVHTRMAETVSRPDIDMNALIETEDIADAAEYLLTHRGNAVIDEIQMHRVGKQPF